MTVRFRKYDLEIYNPAVSEIDRAVSEIDRAYFGHRPCHLGKSDCAFEKYVYDRVILTSMCK
tara:strand:- start:155 stop:340 length:186 start_codon:yes stop_codon:yes gene_type:complete